MVMPAVALVSFCSCAWWWSRGGCPPGAGRVHGLRYRMVLAVAKRWWSLCLDVVASWRGEDYAAVCVHLQVWVTGGSFTALVGQAGS